MAAREWRLRIHAAGTTTPADGTVAYTFDSEIQEPPEVGGQAVRILDGRSESQPWQVKLVDAAGSVTTVLGDANDRAQLGYRIADISKRDDAGSWVILATGRIAGITLNDVAGYVVEVQDERVVERNTTLWKGSASTTSLYGAGFTAGNYGPFTNPPALTGFNFTVPDVEFQRDSHTGNSTRVRINPSHGPDSGTSALLDFIKDDVKADAEPYVVPGSATAGSYRTLRLRMDGEGSDREIIGFRAFTLTLTNSDGRLKALGTMDIYDPSNTFATGKGYLYAPTTEPTDEIPLHIESRPGDLLEAIYDGDYSNTTAVRYDSTAMTALKNRLQADGIGSLRWRITGTQKMSSWLEENIYQPLGIVPLIGNDGAVKPVKVYPTGAEISSVGSLFEFTESNSRLMSWEYAPKDAVSLVRATYPVESVDAFESVDEIYYTGRSFDVLTETEHEYEESHDTVSDSDKVLELKLRGWHDVLRVAQFMALRGREVFEMFGDGPLSMRLWGASASDGVEPGDYVVVDHSAMPSPTGQRGDSRVCFVLSRTALANGYHFDMIEVGPSANPLSAPTVSVAQSGNGATVTFTNVPSGATWELRMHDGDSVSAPSDTSTGWRTIATGTAGTYTVAKIKHGVKVWFQARSRQAGRIPSDWSVADDLTITALSAPTALTITEQGGVFLRATFTAGEDDLPTEVHLDGFLKMTVAAGSDAFRVLGMEPNTTYDSPGLQVRHRDPFTGAVSAFDTVTFTTLATAEAPPAYDSAVLLIGESG